MNETIQEVKEAYERFQYHFDIYNGFYIYNKYEKDLNILLKFVKSELEGLEGLK